MGIAGSTEQIAEFIRKMNCNFELEGNKYD